MQTADHSSPDDGGTNLTLDASEVLGNALSHGLDLPLAALRASMESINNSLPSDAKGNGPLAGALDEVLHLGRNVRELVEYATSPDPMPLRCTPLEIAIAARNALPAHLRPRVLLARASANETIRADAPLLTRCLQRLLENSLEANSEIVLLVVRREPNATHFSVIDESPAAFDPNWALAPFHSTKRNHLGLGLVIATRDVELMGGQLKLKRTQQQETSVLISIPDVGFASTGEAA